MKPRSVSVLLVLSSVLASPGPARPIAAEPRTAPEWDFQREIGPPAGLSTGEVAEIRFLVAAERGLRVVLTQIDADSGGVASSANDLDLQVEGPDGVFDGHALPEEVSMGPGALPLEHVELAADELTAGVWTVRVLGEWVPSGPQGYRLSVAGDVQEILRPGLGVSRAELSQNDPNPVRDRTTIRFTLEGRGDVLLGVYDIAGRPVRSLASGSFSSGPHAVAWDSRDAAGDRVAPGIYFYRLEGVGIDITRKLVVIR